MLYYDYEGKELKNMNKTRYNVKITTDDKVSYKIDCYDYEEWCNFIEKNYMWWSALEGDIVNDN